MIRRRLAVLVGAALLASCGGSADAGPVTVEFTAADGSQTSLADFGGTPVVVNLWATWCAPCLAEMPVFDAAADALAGRVAVIGVNVGDDRAEVDAFADGLGVGYPMFTDPDGLLSAALGVTQLPTTAFVAADGTLLEVHRGAYAARELDDAISRAFPEVGS